MAGARGCGDEVTAGFCCGAPTMVMPKIKATMLTPRMPATTRQCVRSRRVDARHREFAFLSETTSARLASVIGMGDGGLAGLGLRGTHPSSNWRHGDDDKQLQHVAPVRFL